MNPQNQNVTTKTISHAQLFVIAVIAGLAAHLYSMVNLLGSDDSILEFEGLSRNFVIRSLEGASTGRWLGGIVSEIGGDYRTAPVSGLLAILVMALTVLFVVDILKIRTMEGRIAAAVLLEVSPVMQAYVTLHEVSYPISALLATISVALLLRMEAEPGNRAFFRKEEFWIAALLEGLALVIMPVNVSCTVVLVLLCVIRGVLAPEADTVKIWKFAGHAILMVIGGGLFLILSSVVLMQLVSLPASTYQGAAEAMNGGFLFNLGGNLVQCIKKFIVIALWKPQIMPSLRFTFWLNLALSIGLAVALFIRRKRVQKSDLSLLVLSLVMLPFFTCAITLISYGFMYRGQHRQSLLYLLLGVVMLFEQLMQDMRLTQAQKAASVGAGNAEHVQTLAQWTRPFHMAENGWIRLLAAVVGLDLALMSYGFFLYDNIGYVNQHHVMQWDQTLCTRILTALDADPEFSYDDPVYFVNVTTWDGDESISPLKADPELYSVIWPVATSDLYCWGDTSVRGHMKRYEGVDLVSPSAEAADAIEASDVRNRALQLKSWEFEIEHMEDTTVVLVKTVMPPNVLYG